MNNDQIQNAADKIACMAYQMYKPEPEKLLKTDVFFDMFSYDRIVRNVLYGMAVSLMQRGYNQDEVIEKLQSRDVRHMLDQNDEQLVVVGIKLGEKL